ncbi:MAG: hypothetical protein ABIQ86_15435 [Steroidobacteraceae bacterium]
MSDHSPDYSPAAFVGDVAALLDHLGARGAVVLMATRWAASMRS